MSAIAGVYLLNGDSVDEKDLKRMNDSMPHRGPDGSGLWHGGPVGLAHQMLWTTPESLHEKLPFEADGLVITSDSRIDNREELLPELGLSEEVSDSEVILKAYGRLGKSCVDRLLGDFAFVIWDKAKEEMFCARDHMGVRPFYYYYKPGEIFAFATEIKALFGWGVPREINEVAIGDYLVAVTEDKEITFYQNIFRLKPANIIIVSKNDLRIMQYWELDFSREIRLGSDEEYEKAFREIFTEAVKCRLRSAFPVGSLLSGGLDSSSIVCVARELMPKDQRLKTFSGVFDTVKECDERPYIDAVLAGGCLDAYYIYGDEIGPLTDIERMLWHVDQPLWAPNLFLHWAYYTEAHKQNVRIILDGIDGDTTVSHGRTYITELAGKGRIISMFREIRGLARNFGLDSWRVFKLYSIYPFIREPLIQFNCMRHGTKNISISSFKIVNSDFLNRIGLMERKKILLGERSKPAKTTKMFHGLALNKGIHSIFLEISNIAAAAFSVESRNPFFDKRLMEFCLALPADQKMRRGWTRWIMRSALKGTLPEMIYDRGGKSNISSNFTHGLLTFHKATLDNAINIKNDVINTYVNNSELQNAYHRFRISEERSTNDAVNVWRVLNLWQWLQAIDP